MKKILTVAVFIFSTLSLTVQANELPDEVKNALLNGARVKMTVKVVDEEGMPVSNATTRAYLENNEVKRWKGKQAARCFLSLWRQKLITHYELRITK